MIKIKLNIINNIKAVYGVRRVSKALTSFVRNYFMIALSRCYKLFNNVYTNLSLKMLKNPLFCVLVKWYLSIVLFVYLRFIFAPNVLADEEKKDPTFTEKYLYWVDAKVVAIVVLSVAVSGLLYVVYTMDESHARELRNATEEAEEQILNAGTEISRRDADLTAMRTHIEGEKQRSFEEGYAAGRHDAMQEAKSKFKKTSELDMLGSYQSGVKFGQRQVINSYEIQVQKSYEQGYARGRLDEIANATQRANDRASFSISTDGTSTNNNAPIPITPMRDTTDATVNIVNDTLSNIIP